MRDVNLLVAVALVAVGSAAFAADAEPAAPATCPVTRPNEAHPGTSEPMPGSYGNAVLATGAPGTMVFRPGGPGFVLRDGALGMKFLWRRAYVEPLVVTGRRLDGPSPPLRFDPGTALETQFVPSYLVFPKPGCWEVTAQLGRRRDARLTLVLEVIRVGAGPDWHPNDDARH